MSDEMPEWMEKEKTILMNSFGKSFRSKYFIHVGFQKCFELMSERHKLENSEKDKTILRLMELSKRHLDWSHTELRNKPRPIETCPKDEYVLICFIGKEVNHIEMNKYDNGHGGFIDGDTGIEIYPTHWLPIPSLKDEEN